MARKTVRMSVEQERQVTIRIDFYKASSRADGVSLGDALHKAVSLPQNSRTLTVGKEGIILSHLTESSPFFEGEIARLRMHDTPALGNLNGQISDLPLRVDEGVAERTAFLFHLPSQILTIHAVREAVSAGRLAGYCDVVQASKEGFVFQPVRRVDTLDEFNHLGSIRKVELRIASVGAAAKAPAAARTSVKGYFRLKEFAALEAETISISVSVGRQRNRGLVTDSARRLVRGLLDNKDRLNVETLIVSGKQAGDEAVILDLLKGRVREDISISVRGRSATYTQRIDALHQAFEANRALFEPVS